MKYGYRLGHVVAAFLLGILVGFLFFCIVEDALEKEPKARHRRHSGNSQRKKRSVASRPNPKHQLGGITTPRSRSGSENFPRNAPDTRFPNKKQTQQAVFISPEKEKQLASDFGSTKKGSGISVFPDLVVPLTEPFPDHQAQKVVSPPKTSETGPLVLEKTVKQEPTPKLHPEAVAVSKEKTFARTRAAAKSKPVDLSGFTKKLCLEYDDILGTEPFLKDGRGYLLNPASGEVIPEQSEWSGVLTLQTMARTGVLMLFTVEINGKRWTDQMYREDSQLKKTTTYFQLRSVKQPAIIQDKYQTEHYTVERPGVLVLNPI